MADVLISAGQPRHRAVAVNFNVPSAQTATLWAPIYPLIALSYGIKLQMYKVGFFYRKIASLSTLLFSTDTDTCELLFEEANRTC